jgi:hypothetical protein
MDAHGHHAVIAFMSSFQAHRRLLAGANITSGSVTRLSEMIFLYAEHSGDWETV